MPPRPSGTRNRRRFSSRPHGNKQSKRSRNATKPARRPRRRPKGSQTQEEDRRRLQKALEAAQDQAAAPPTMSGGTPIALALLARELLDLATGGECQGQVQGRLIALATQALGFSQPTHPEKRQDAGGGAAVPQDLAGGGREIAKTNRPPADARFGPLFAGGEHRQPAPPAADVGAGQEAPRGVPGAIQPPTADRPAGDAQKLSEAAEGTLTPSIAPRAFTRRGGASEKLERALRAVLAHNEAQTSREKKWAVTESALARLTGCFRPAVRTFFAARAKEIEAHNQRHHLLPGMNAARGKRGETIETEVDWRRAGEEKSTGGGQTAAPPDG